MQTDVFPDFIAVHINQTQVIHMSGFFLPWHRVFVSLYEKALRTECGYTGAQPWVKGKVTRISEADIFKVLELAPVRKFARNESSFRWIAIFALRRRRSNRQRKRPHSRSRRCSSSRKRRWMCNQWPFRQHDCSVPSIRVR